MTKTTVNPLQTLANAQAIKVAEGQYRLARLFTPYGFEPEKVDFDRVHAFMDDIHRPFPQPTDSIRNALDRIKADLTQSKAMLDAFVSQGINPTLDADQLYMTARANVINPGMARAA